MRFGCWIRKFEILLQKTPRKPNCKKNIASALSTIETYNHSQNIWDFFLSFSIVSIHHKWSWTRLFPPETEWTSCPAICQSMKDLGSSGIRKCQPLNFALKIYVFLISYISVKVFCVNNCSYNICNKNCNAKMYCKNIQATLKGSLWGLRQFLTTESPLKNMKNACYFTLKALFVLKIFKFLSWLFSHVEKRLYQKYKVNFKIYDVKTRLTNNSNARIVQYLTK